MSREPDRDLRDALAEILTSANYATRESKIEAILLLFRKEDMKFVNALMQHIREFLW